jgi:hypothetical protein
VILNDVTADPTLPRTKGVKCGKCGHGEAVFFQSTSRQDTEGMTLFFVCCNSECQVCVCVSSLVSALFLVNPFARRSQPQETPWDHCECVYESSATPVGTRLCQTHIHPTPHSRPPSRSMPNAAT